MNKTSGSRKRKTCQISSFLPSFDLNFLYKRFFEIFSWRPDFTLFYFRHLCSFKKLQTDPCFRNLFGEIGKNWMFVWFISVVKPKLFQKYQLEVFQQTLKLQDKLQNFTTKKSYCVNLNAVADGSNLLKMKNVLVFSRNPNTMLDLIHQDLSRLQFLCLRLFDKQSKNFRSIGSLTERIRQKMLL